MGKVPTCIKSQFGPLAGRHMHVHSEVIYVVTDGIPTTVVRVFKCLRTALGKTFMYYSIPATGVPKDRHRRLYAFP